MGLFANIDTSKSAPKKEKNSGSEIKLKKGETISSLIETAKKLVDEKLSNYKDLSKCVTNLDDLKSFFDNTEEDTEIGIDTETTG